MRKLLSLMLSIALVLTSVGICYTVFADTPEFEVSTDFATSDLVSDNLLSGTPYFVDGNGSASQKTASNDSPTKSTALLVDGNFENTVEGLKFWNGTDATFTYGLGGFYNVTQIALATGVNESLSIPVKPVAELEVYVGDNDKTLYNSDNKVLSYTNTAAATKFLFTLDSAVKGNYIGFKIVNSGNDEEPGTGNVYINELGAYGTNSTVMTTLTSIPTDNNLIAGTVPYSMINSTGADHIKSYGEVSNGNSNLSVRWSDGTVNYPYSLRVWNAKGLRMAYDLGNTFDVSRVMLASGGTEGSNVTPHITKWKVYASNEKGTLFSGANCVGLLTADAGTTSFIQAADFADGISARYIGIETLDHGDSSTANMYITEVGIYGSISASAQSEFVPIAAPKNVLTGVTSVKYKQATSTATFENRTTGYSNNAAISNLVDGNFSGNWIAFFNANYSGYSSYYVFETAEAHTVDKVMVVTYPQDGTYNYAYQVKYAAYVSNDFDKLFRSENLLAICDNPENVNNTAVQSNSAKTGKYFGIKVFYSSANTSNAIRFYEMGFYEANECDVNETTVANGKNILDGKTMYYTQGNTTSTNTTTATVNSHGAARSVALLTDGNLYNEVTTDFGGYGLKFYNGDKARFLYDMGASVDITEVLVAGGLSTTNTETNDMAIRNYAVYVSNSNKNIFSAESQVAYVYNADNAAAQLLDFSGLGIKGQYIGIYVYDGGAKDTNVYVNEIAVYGNYTTDAYTIINEPDTDYIEGLGVNALTGKTPDGIEDTNGVLTDGVIYNADAVTLDNADGAKISYDLGVTQSVSSIFVAGVYDLKNNIAPLHYKLYVSNSAETLWDSAAVEYYNVGYEPNSGKYPASVQLFELTDNIEGQFVGIEVISAAFNSTTLTLCELAVYSTVEIPLTGSITDVEKVYVDGVYTGSSTELSSGLLVGAHSVVVYNSNADYEVYLVKDGIFTYKENLTNAFEAKGVQIRTVDPLGLRFVSSITNAAADDEAVVKYGMVVAKSATLNSNSLILGSEDYLNADAVAYNKATGDKIVYAEDENSVSFSAALYNFEQKHYLTWYAVRPYLVIEDSEGNSYTVYGDAVESNIYDVAKQAYADSSASYSDSVTEYLENIVNNSSISAVTLADVKDIFPEDANTEALLETSVTSEGNQARLARVIKKAMNGEDITLGVLGGSITQGYSADMGKAYADRLREWLENTFNVNVKLVNAGIGSTTSVIGVHRIENDLLQYNPDLVILEYAVNETDTDSRTRETYENCIRRILSKGEDIALIMLFTVKQSGENNQAAQAEIGSAYGLPMISYKDGVYPLVEDGTLTWADISPDTIHPNNYGHQLINALLSNYIAGVIENIDSIDTDVPAMPDAINGETYMNSTLYTSETLPAEWVVQYGDMNIVHDAYHQFPHGWKATYTDGTTEPMILNIPSAKAVTMLVLRVNDKNAVNASTETVSISGISNKQNLLNYLNNNYADAITVYKSDVSEQLTVTITPNTVNEGEYFVLLGIMVAE